MVQLKQGKGQISEMASSLHRRRRHNPFLTLTKFWPKLLKEISLLCRKIL
jgi:hypothetical protein